MLYQLRLIIIALLIIPVNAFAQAYKDIVIDKATINYPDQTVTVEFKPVKQIVSPQSDKRYYWYASNRIHITQGGYRGKLLNGLYSGYYLNKNLKEAGNFKNGLKTGTWDTWVENGNLKEKTLWKSGLKNGTYFKYDSTGAIAESGRYKNDVLKKVEKSKWRRLLNKAFKKKAKAVKK